MLKIYVDNSDSNIIHTHNGRPFNLVDIQLCDDPDEADYIFAYLGPARPVFWPRIRKTELFKKYESKYVFYANYDRPNFAYKTKAIKFLSQPLYGPVVNRKHRVIPCPLTMGRREIVKDRIFIERCRNIKKTLNFIFMGSNQNIPARKFMKSLNLPKFRRVETKKIYRQPDRIVTERIRKFLLDTARAKYCFAPRGMGTSSYRLYEALMVGTVPIVSGMADYPFADEVDWKSFAIINNFKINYESLLDGRHEDMRRAGMKFWDEYVYMPKCYNRLVESLA